MYKVLVVDDEILARVGIKSIIPWNELGFEYVGECENGQKALEISREVKPDIIITDIKMPVMNGIELIRAVKSEKIGSKFIVLSSYDDFEYVKEAMQLGAEDYVLKLQMEPESLLKVLTDVCRKVDQERMVSQRGEFGQMQLKRDIPALREMLMKELMLGTERDEETIAECIRESGLLLKPQNIICLAIKVENFQMDSSDGNINLLIQSITNIAEEMIQNYGYGYVSRNSMDTFILVCSLNDRENGGSAEKTVERLTRDIRDFLRDTMNLTVFMGVSNVYQSYRDIKHAYREVVKTAGKDIVYSSDGVIHYNSIKNLPDKGSGIPLEINLNELDNSLRAFDTQRIEASFNIIKSAISEMGYASKRYLDGVCHIMIFIINMFIQENHISPNDIWGKDQNPYRQIELLGTLEDFTDWILNVQGSICRVISQDKDQKTIILKAKQFINNHYKENISLEIVAEYLHISPNYFSKLFSEEAEEGFVDYVTRVRIDSAKELLKTTQYKVYEVAEMVGYDNTHYFSRLFKKATGISPIDYKAHSVDKS